MNTFSPLTTNHPIVFVLGLTIAWFILLMVFMGVASSVLCKPYGDAITTMIGQLAVTGGTEFLFLIGKPIRYFLNSL